MDSEWMATGNCAHESPTTFCPVKEPCLEHALAHRIDHGVWGGCSERERRRILKRRRSERLAAATA